MVVCDLNPKTSHVEVGRLHTGVGTPQTIPTGSRLGGRSTSTSGITNYDNYSACG